MGIEVRSVAEAENAIALIKKNAIAKRCIKPGYTRVSSNLNSQDTSIERQIKDFQDAGCNLILVERESGRKAENRELYQLLTQIIKEEIVEIVFITASSRIHRNYTNSDKFYILCEVYKVEIFFIDEPELNGTGQNVSKLRKQKAYYAEMESVVVSGRVKAGYERDEKDGKYPSRIAPLGYRLNKRYLVLDKFDPTLQNAIAFLPLPEGNKYYAGLELGRFVVEAYLELRSLSKAFWAYKDLLQILTPCNDKRYGKELSRNMSWLSNWLRDPVQRGSLVYGKTKMGYRKNNLNKQVKIRVPRDEWRIYADNHEALISPSEGKEIDRLLKINQNYGYSINNSIANPNHPVPLGQILRCKKCGLKFVSSGGKLRKNGSWRPRYYNCNGKFPHKKCSVKGIGEQTLTRELIEQIISKAEDLAKILNAAEDGLVIVDSSKLQLYEARAAQAQKDYAAYGLEEDLATYRSLTQKADELKVIAVKETNKVKEQQDLIFALSSPDFWQQMSLLDLHRYLLGIVEIAWIEDGQVVLVELSL